ncbi:hypothetical protein [Prauserella rugosa]|uniref:Uncharacterized protein n=1 Tax=Prauserella rugosa TaxID=43354 RepID=A0A660CEV9_9PSEU|nr:hypothetical protein [Prauserella rugosa]TWH20944.1 hypothetical protein JD82_02795 [Prauserella rugosa]
MTTTTATLTVAEADQLADLEAVIAQGLQTFVRVGQALLTIRDNRLYRKTHETFEEYCRERWEMTKDSANRVIRAAEVVEVMSPIGLTPATESQARELAPLKDDPDAMRAVWETANERTDGKPTAKVIRECREELTAEPEILDAEVVDDDVPDHWEPPQDPDERRRFRMAKVHQQIAIIEKALDQIPGILMDKSIDGGDVREFNEEVRSMLDLMIKKAGGAKEFTFEEQQESASRVLANDIRLWLNHLQTEPEMDDLSDREKWHVIEGLRETADALEGQLK